MKLSEEQKAGMDQIFESILEFVRIKTGTDSRLKDLTSGIAPFGIFIKCALEEIRHAPQKRAIQMHLMIIEFLKQSMKEIGSKCDT